MLSSLTSSCSSEGEESFDPAQHWQVRDFAIRRLSTGAYALMVRFKRVKQDARIQRPEVRGDGSQDPSEAREGGSDWAIVGDIPGHPLSPFKWYRLLMSFYPDGREREAPMFMARDRARPYIYSAGLADLKMLIGRFQSDVDFGVHGLRVSGYNASLRKNGESLTVAHGLWKSGAHTRYGRFTEVSAGGIPALMVGEPNPYAVRAETEGAAVGGARTQRLNTFLFTTGGRGRGGRDGRGRGRTGSTVPTAEAETGEAAPPTPPEAEAEGDGTEGAGNGGGSGSRLLSFSPPRRWSRGDDGRYVPPPHLARVGPQDTVVAAWAVHRQLALLETDRVDVGDEVRARTRHGA